MLSVRGLPEENRFSAYIQSYVCNIAYLLPYICCEGKKLMYGAYLSSYLSYLFELPTRLVRVAASEQMQTNLRLSKSCTALGDCWDRHLNLEGER